MNRSSRALSTSQGLLATQLVLQVFAGFILAFWYQATPQHAYDSIWWIRAHPFPNFLLSLQYWGLQIFFVHSGLHLLCMLKWGTCTSEWIPRWYLSIVSLLAGYVLLATGNFLLFDRHGVQSAVIEVSIVNSVPFVGPVFADWARGGEFGANTLTLWNVIYRWTAPLLLLTFAGVGFFYRRYDEESRSDYRLIGLGAFVPIIVAIFLKVPLGPRATSVDYTSFDALVNWYAWPLHGLLKAFGAISPSIGWIGALVLPGLFVAMLFCLPWLCNKVTHVFAQTIFVVFAAAFLVLSFLFGGVPASPFDRSLPVSSEIVSPVATNSTPVSQTLFDQGKKEFTDAGCVDCHGIDGVKNDSGPDLTTVNKKHGDVEWYIKWIRNPSSVKPGSTMPAYPNLTQDQLKALGEYLRKPR